MDVFGILSNWWIFPFVLVFSILVFVHEMGHYWVARRCGVRVEVFSIGFGPEIYGWHDRVGTRWKVSAVPLGGYVKMFGEHDFDGEQDASSKPADLAVSFSHKSLWQRSAIVAAGPAANFLFAIVAAALLFAIVGVRVQSASPDLPAVVGKVQPGSPAETAGLVAGDVVVSADGEPVALFADLQRIVRNRPDVPIAMQIRRGEEELTVRLIPESAEIVDAQGVKRTGGRIGIAAPEHAGAVQVTYERVDPFTAVWKAVEWTGALTTRILGALWQIIVGERSAEELGGPLRIAQISSEMAQEGMIELIMFAAVLSINLGLINLFPIPMLDGGHLAFYAVEAVRGKPLNPRVQEYSFRFGLVLVLLLMIFATRNDLKQFLQQWGMWDLF